MSVLKRSRLFMQDESSRHHHLLQQQTKNVSIQGKKSTRVGFPEFLWAGKLFVFCCVIFQVARIKANKDDLQILVALAN